MPNVTLTFPGDINISCQIGDTAYYVPTTSLGGFDTSLNTNGETQQTIVEIGPISNIDHLNNIITCSPDLILTNTQPSTNDFIFFSKDNAVNMSSPTGYYAQVKFINNSKVKSEMFATACDVFESSK